MIRTFIVRPEAEIDLAEAYDWYEHQRQGLGEDFFLRVEAAFESIRYDPQVCTKIYKNVRRKLVRRFPYGIFFAISQNKICVLAVLHAKRNPTLWQNRIK